MPLPSRVGPVISVLAGVNGAGKSSVAGEWIRRAGVEYFNPDDVARHLRHLTNYSIDDANSLAWQIGRGRLEQAIRDRADFAFESTF